MCQTNRTSNHSCTTLLNITYEYFGEIHRDQLLHNPCYYARQISIQCWLVLTCFTPANQDLWTIFSCCSTFMDSTLQGSFISILLITVQNHESPCSSCYGTPELDTNSFESSQFMAGTPQFIFQNCSHTPETLNMYNCSSVSASYLPCCPRQVPIPA